jgi:phosphatidate cytidylyltransferase
MMDRNLLIRTLVAVVFGPLIILISYLGGNWLIGMILLFAIIGAVEFMINIRVGVASATFWISLAFVGGMVATSLLVSPNWGMNLFVGYFLSIGLIMAVRRGSPEGLYATYTSLIWGMAYLGLLYPFIFYIRAHFPETGGDWLLFLFGTLWLSDSLAMWIGKSIGRRMLAPNVSPNKTVEGFIAGMFGGVIVAVILGYWRLSEVMLPLLVAAGLLISVVGQLGDLVESVWKRSLGIKDSSRIIPGHGGVLDRFDSLLFAAPALYWFLKFVIFR